MSYDIWLEVDLGGPEPIRIDNGWNYTSNCGPMWRAAGIDLAECHGRDAGRCAEELRAAINTLKADPARFQAMNPPNGWGSFDTLVPALEELLKLFESAPRAIVRVSC